MNPTQVSWLRQPTTMLGFAMIVASGAMAFFGLIPVAAFGCVLAPALGLLALDDNTAARADIQTAAIDAVTSATTNHLKDNLPRLINEAMKVASDFAAKTATGLVLAIVCLSLAACGAMGSGTTAAEVQAKIHAQIQAAAPVACATDGVAQPIAADVLEALVPGATTAAAVTVDQLLVHPAIVKYCAKIGAKPAAIVSAPAAPAPTPAAAPAATPAALAPATAKS